jgi:hypothetical protein
VRRRGGRHFSACNLLQHLLRPLLPCCSGTVLFLYMLAAGIYCAAILLQGLPRLPAWGQGVQPHHQQPLVQPVTPHHATTNQLAAGRSCCPQPLTALMA